MRNNTGSRSRVRRMAIGAGMAAVLPFTVAACAEDEPIEEREEVVEDEEVGEDE